MRDHVASGLVRESTVNAILALGQGEPMLSDRRGEKGYPWPHAPWRAYVSRKYANGSRGSSGGDIAATAQAAADALLRNLGGREASGG